MWQNFIFALFSLATLSVHGEEIYNECPRNFLQQGEKCYYVEEKMLNWFDAQLSCQQLNASLVTIESDYDMQFLTNYLSKNFIRFYEGYSTGFWTAGNDKGEPNDYGDYGEDCVQLISINDEYFMNDIWCSFDSRSICEFKLSRKDSIVNSTIESRMESTTELITDPTTESTMETTTELIKDQTTEAIMETVTELLTDSTMGLSEIITDSTTESTMETTTDSTTETITHSTTLKTTMEEAIYNECPRNFLQQGENCYYVEEKEQNWFNAQHSCRQMHANLVTIENANKMQILTNFLNKNFKSFNGVYKTGFWTAGNDLGKENIFRWNSNGNNMTYTKWNKGEPNDYGDYGEDCVQIISINSEYFMNDKWCSFKCRSICEFKLSKLSLATTTTTVKPIADHINECDHLKLLKLNLDSEIKMVELMQSQQCTANDL